jgi:hypothetical protein
MAYSSLDPVTGSPVFLDSDAPDPAVNPSQVAAYAGQVGTRLIGTTAERTAYSYDREGLEWFDTTTKTLYVNNGSGWSPVYRKRATYTPTLTGITVGSGGTATATYAIVGGFLRVDIDITFGSGLAITDPNVSLPSGFDHLGSTALVGDLYLQDVSAGVGGRYRGALQEGVSGYLRFVRMNAANGQMAPMSDTATPFAWTSGDRVVGSALIPIV